MADIWFIDARRALINWDAAVVGSRANTTIYRLVTLPGQVGEVRYLWADVGSVISTTEIDQARRQASYKPLPASGDPDYDGGSGDGCSCTPPASTCGCHSGSTSGGRGPAGPSGPRGPQGPDGVRGSDGARGADGAPGPAGAAGAAGAPGTPGSPGVAGVAGVAGQDGKGIEFGGGAATYGALPTGLGQAAAGKGYLVQSDGRLYVWDGSRFPADGAGVEFRGPVGPAGPAGPAGAAGARGTSGADGATGPAGTPGQKGDAGPKGETGAQGPAGPAGAGGTGAGGGTGTAGPAGPAGPKGDRGDRGATGDAGVDGLDGPAGPAGARGQNGALGPKGTTGDPGPSGAEGAQGPTGATGPKGATGNPGSDGNPGPSGASGPAGTTGTTGATGAKGDAGNPGAPGAKGDPGAPGAKGETGTAGSTGTQGPAGVKGDTGNPGAPGSSGASGADGKTGPKGDTGAAGAPGTAGTNGTPGAKGDKGDPGQQGPIGPAGPSGSGSTGTGPGPQGPAGAAGPTGAKGDTGDPGPAGTAGTPGAKGDAGAAGPEGPKGTTGTTGATGATGAAGTSPTLAVGTVSTGAPGSSAAVVAGGTASARTFSFTLPAGANGTPGSTGTPGGAGPKGDTGAAGAAGPKGETGAAGTAGPAGTGGPAGPAGAKGDTGATGGPGAKGDAGAPGVRGAAGNDGSTGPAGPEGIAGPTGTPGATGTAGPAGPDGRSSYEVARDEGYGGTRTQWLASLRGPQGNPGPAGTGAAGAPAQGMSALSRRSSKQSIPSGAWTKVSNYGLATYNDTGGFDAGALTLTSAGRYTVTASVVFSTLSAGSKAVAALYVNGALHCILGRGASSASDYAEFGGALTAQFAAGDVLAVYAFQNTGADVQLGNASTTGPDVDGYGSFSVTLASTKGDTGLTGPKGDPGTNGGISTPVAGVALDSFAGNTDDEKLTAALTYIKAQTVKPPLLFGSRQYTFAQANRPMFSGLKLIGGPGHGNQQRAANSIPNDLRFTGTGAWWVLAPDDGETKVFDVAIEGLSFQGRSVAQFLRGGTTVLWTSVIRDVGFNLWKHVLGTPTEKLLLTACQFGGWWNINNSYDTAITVGGSDCSALWSEGGLIDSPPSIIRAGAPHIILDYLEKSTVGPLYITAEADAGGMLIKGSATGSGLELVGHGTIEGRNKDAACNGSLLRHEGGGTAIHGWSFNYAMKAPAARDLGVITQTGGSLYLHGVWYDRAVGVAETVPLLGQSGGVSDVERAMTGSKGGAWSTTPGRPAVRATGGLLQIDGSVNDVGGTGVRANGPGPAGPKGDPGAAGAAGAAGPKGDAGIAGPVGPLGPVGPRGEPGPAGSSAPAMPTDGTTDIGPILQAAYDAGATSVQLNSAATYLIDSPVFFDKPDLLSGFVINGNKARLVLGPNLPTTDWPRDPNTRFAFFPNTKRTALAAGKVTVSDATRVTGANNGALRTFIARDLTVDGKGGYRGFCYANRTACGFDSVILFGARVCHTWWDYADVATFNNCYCRGVAGGPPEQVFFEQFQAGDGVASYSGKADSNTTYARLKGNRGGVFHGMVLGRLEFDSCSAVTISGTHFEGMLANIVLIKMKSSQVTVRDSAFYRNWTVTKPSITIDDGDDSQTGSELNLDNVIVQTSYQGIEGAGPQANLVDVLSSTEFTRIQGRNVKPMMTSNGIQGKWVDHITPPFGGPAQMVAATRTPSGATAIASGTFTIARGGPGWRCYVDDPSMTLTHGQSGDPAILQALSGGGTFTGGGTMANTPVQYAVAVMDAGGNYSKASPVVTVTPNTTAKMVLLLFSVVDPPGVLVVWRATTGDVLTAPTEMVVVGTRSRRVYANDTGAALGGVAWEAPGGITPAAVASSNKTAGLVVIDGVPQALTYVIPKGGTVPPNVPQGTIIFEQQA